MSRGSRSDKLCVRLAAVIVGASAYSDAARAHEFRSQEVHNVEVGIDHSVIVGQVEVCAHNNSADARVAMFQATVEEALAGIRKAAGSVKITEDFEKFQKAMTAAFSHAHDVVWKSQPELSFFIKSEAEKRIRDQLVQSVVEHHLEKEGDPETSKHVAWVTTGSSGLGIPGRFSDFDLIAIVDQELHDPATANASSTAPSPLPIETAPRMGAADIYKLATKIAEELKLPRDSGAIGEEISNFYAAPPTIIRAEDIKTKLIQDLGVSENLAKEFAERWRAETNEQEAEIVEEKTPVVGEVRPDSLQAVVAAVKQDLHVIFGDIDVSLPHMGPNLETAVIAPADQAQSFNEHYTKFLAMRYVAGNEALAKQLKGHWEKHLAENRLLVFTTLIDWWNARYTQIGKNGISRQGHVYASQPDYKESIGGLRDLHFLWWVALTLGYKIENFEDLMSILDHRGVPILAEEDAAAVRHAVEFMQRLSEGTQGKHELTFARQAAVGRKLAKEREGVIVEDDRAAAERVLREYYGHAANVFVSIYQAVRDLLHTVYPEIPDPNGAIVGLGGVEAPFGVFHSRGGGFFLELGFVIDMARRFLDKASESEKLDFGRDPLLLMQAVHSGVWYPGEMRFGPGLLDQMKRDVDAFNRKLLPRIDGAPNSEYEPETARAVRFLFWKSAGAPPGNVNRFFRRLSNLRHLDGIFPGWGDSRYIPTFEDLGTYLSRALLTLRNAERLIMLNNPPGMGGDSEAAARLALDFARLRTFAEHGFSTNRAILNLAILVRPLVELRPDYLETEFPMEHFGLMAGTREAEEFKWLVRNYDKLKEWALEADINDPAAISQFLDDIGRNPTRLDWLLTICAARGDVGRDGQPLWARAAKPFYGLGEDEIKNRDGWPQKFDQTFQRTKRKMLFEAHGQISEDVAERYLQLSDLVAFSDKSDAERVEEAKLVQKLIDSPGRTAFIRLSPVEAPHSRLRELEVVLRGNDPGQLETVLGVFAKSTVRIENAHMQGERDRTDPISVMRFWLNPDAVQDFQTSGGGILSESISKLEANTDQALRGDNLDKFFPRAVDLSKARRNGTYEVSLSPGARDTIVRIQGPSTDYLLLTFANVLAKNGMNIQELYPRQMDVPFKGPHVDDIFYITKNGRTLTEDEQFHLKREFENALSSDRYMIEK